MYRRVQPPKSKTSCTGGFSRQGLRSLKGASPLGDWGWGPEASKLKDPLPEGKNPDNTRVSPFSPVSKRGDHKFAAAPEPGTNNSRKRKHNMPAWNNRNLAPLFHFLHYNRKKDNSCSFLPPSQQSYKSRQKNCTPPMRRAEPQWQSEGLQKKARQASGPCKRICTAN